MVRIKASVARKKGRKRLFKLTKGYYGQKKNRYVQAIKASIRAMKFSSKHRRARARDMRSLWVARINAACRENGLIYSRLIRGLKEAKVGLDRKMLAEIAINDHQTFVKIVAIADKALPANITRMK